MESMGSTRRLGHFLIPVSECWAIIPSNLRANLPNPSPSFHLYQQSACFVLRPESALHCREASRIWHMMLLSQSCMQQSYPVILSRYSPCANIANTFETARHTKRYFRSFACGRDAMHLVMARKGSVVPKHSALSLCWLFASRSMLTRNFSILAPETNRAYQMCQRR